jgi:hypothetical protein
MVIVMDVGLFEGAVGAELLPPPQDDRHTALAIVARTLKGRDMRTPWSPPLFAVSKIDTLVTRTEDTHSGAHS